MKTSFRLDKSAAALKVKGHAALLLFLLSFLGFLSGQAQTAPTNELTSAAQIRHFSREQADLRYPVRLRGVVTYFDDRIATKSFRFIQDDSAGIYFYEDGSANNPPLKTGQLIELEGETGAGSFAPVVTAHRIRILGETNLPEAKKVSFEELESGQEDSQFVEISGVVRAVRFDSEVSHYLIDLATGQGRLTLEMSQLPVAQGDQLVDSVVRAKGVCITHFNLQRQLFDFGLLIPEPEDLVIVSKAPAAPDLMPEQPIGSVMQYTWGSRYAHRIKVTGLVTLRYGETMYIQDQTNGLCVETKEMDAMPTGDRVEVIGFPAKGVYAPRLENSVYHLIEQGSPLQPDKITPDEALTGAYDCRLVQIEATLLDRAQHSKEPFLVLQAKGYVFHAYMKSQGQSLNFDQLQNGSKLLVTGVCAIDDVGEEWHFGPDWRAASFRLLLRSPDDVVVLASPPWWTLTKLFWAIGVLCAILLTAFGWVVLLRHRVHRQTQIIEEKLHTEAAIKERYLDLFENANDMVFTHDLRGRMTSINKAGERLLQQPRGEILNKDMIDLIAEDEKPAAREWLKRVTSGEETAAVDWDFLNAAGQRLKLEVSSRRVEQDGRIIEVEGVARDVTARKRMENEILEISNREQQRLGHDLHDGVCQQLAAIAYRAHIMARQLKEKNFSESTEASDISELINESLVQTRTVARGLFPVRLEEDGLAAAVEELTINIGRLYNIHCDYATSGTLPTMHNSVAMHLHFIAQEAIMNAAKHSRASVITVRLNKENDFLVMTIKDNGVGFEAADEKRSGMGVGIMKYRAKAIGGLLELISQRGQGTQVTCRYHLQTDEPS